MSRAVPLSDVRSALVVTAHPDDVDFGAAGTVASWTSAGIKVSYCVCTSGEASGDGQVSLPAHHPPTASPASRAEVARVRRAEQRAAAERVGVHDVTFLDHPDGAVFASIELRRDISRVIRTVRPDRVLTWSPEINWEHVPTTHPDHRAVGEATFAAVYPDARNPNAHPELLAEEGLRPWTVRELWLADGPRALRNHLVDVTDFFDVRVAALRAHESQVGAMTDLEEFIRRLLADTAARHGLADGRLAEEFQIVDTR